MYDSPLKKQKDYKKKGYFYCIFANTLYIPVL